MKPVNIPIRNLLTEPEEAVEFMPMPHEMSTFSMPDLPRSGPDKDIAGALDLLRALIEHFDAWLEAGMPRHQPPRLDVAKLPAAALRVLNETLGEGEVAAIVDAGHEIRVQETVFAGVWREQHFDADGRLRHDYLLAAPVPPVLVDLARSGSQPRLRERELPTGAMNVPALVNELQDAMDRCRPDVPAHVVNLTLLPLSPEDVAHLDALLDGGRVVILSRGFGNCRISSTSARHVWRVQYFNNMQTLILNTVEVVDIPDVALAAREDLVESRDRLIELAQWMGESLAEA